MWVLRKGGDFADRRIESYVNEMVKLFAFGAVVLIVLGYFGLQIVGVFAAVALVLANKKTYRLFRRWSVGKEGEAKVLDVLRSLSNDYVVLNDLVLPGRGNVDHFLVGPNGLFVIETKNYSGHVKCDGDRWFVYRREINSLSKQARRNSMAIRANLESLHAEKGARVPYVTPLLVFVNKETKLKLFKPTIAILRLEELVDFIRNCKANWTISADQRHAIVRHLQSLQIDTVHSPVTTLRSQALSRSR